MFSSYTGHLFHTDLCLVSLQYPCFGRIITTEIRKKFLLKQVYLQQIYMRIEVLEAHTQSILKIVALVVETAGHLMNQILHHSTFKN